MKLRMADSTEQFIQSYSKALPHAVLLTGQQGVGLYTLASHIVESNGILVATVVPESKGTALPSISVERIRELYVETRARLQGKNFVIIDDADGMTLAAQNALLKLLEEPNESISFILTSHNPDKLLPTIRSRSQAFVVPPVPAVESSRLLKTLGVKDPVTEQRITYVASGLPAEMTRLLANESDFKKLLERVELARGLVAGSTYQRLTTSMRLGADRHELIKVLDMSLLLLRKSLASKPDVATMESIQRIITASESIRANGNAKLVIARAMIQ